jgi:GAF domain-containing protein
VSADVRAAVAAGVLVAERDRAPLLQSIVEVARAIFGAQAASITLHDETAGELVFEAVAGEGEEALTGRRIAADRGIAGWVLQSRQPIVIEDVEQDPRFAGDVARTTGYVPKGIMAAPLEHDERVLGVLSVLDRPQRSRFTLIEMDLLGLFANQAAIALALVEAGRRVERSLAADEGDLGAVARVAGALESLEGRGREAGGRLLEALAEVLEGRRRAAP